MGKLIRLLRFLFNAHWQAIRSFHGDKYTCPVCHTGVAYFLHFPIGYLDDLHKHRFQYSIFNFETLNIQNALCPKCKCGDSNRLYALYLSKKLNQLRKPMKFLDFAPVLPLADLIQKNPLVNYRSADLYMKNVDDKVDIQNMSIYKDSSFDAFLCSHMLEHVADDRAAVKELYRILNPGGWGILMVPILLNITHTIENLPANTPQERWHNYGQGDHVRIYAKTDYLNLLKSNGFSVTQLTQQDFGKKSFLKAGIDSRSVLYIVRK